MIFVFLCTVYLLSAMRAWCQQNLNMWNLKEILFCVQDAIDLTSDAEENLTERAFWFLSFPKCMFVWFLYFYVRYIFCPLWELDVNKTWTCEIWRKSFFVCRMRSIWPLMLRRIWQRGLSDSYLFLSACVYDFCISMYGISFVRYESLMLTKLERVKFKGNLFLCAGCDRSDLWCWGESDREGFLIPIFS